MNDDVILRDALPNMKCSVSRIQLWGPFLDSPENFSGPKS